ncbi:MAG: GGDEF domain-containing protein [Thermoanaerobaculia bacterium]|jgi:diguanylate cyclase (GGDEF)-like protein|nr:GGDEF domain-containing protein [Thermoanaerobaculia bacterium]
MAEIPDLIDAFGAGLYVLFGIIQLDLWLRRRERRGHLWLAGAISGALLVDVTGILLRRSGTTTDPGLQIANHLGVVVASICLFELFAVLAPRHPVRGVRLLYASALLPLPSALVTGTTDLLALSLLSCAVLILLAGSRAVLEVLSGDREARLLAAGFVVLALCLLLDLLMEFGLLPTVPGAPIAGFFILFVAAAQTLAERSERTLRELEQLRRELEARVDERTAQLRTANLQLAEAARTDSLTGLANRRALLERFEAERRRSARSEAPIALVMADIDHFKRVNDEHGHAAGDRVLQEIAATLRGALRAQDTVARWGGEEFLLLLPETDLEGALVAAEAARTRIEETPVRVGEQLLPVTLSFGAAQHAPQATVDETLAAADRALYRAKKSGRNCVRPA